MGKSLLLFIFVIVGVSLSNSAKACDCDGPVKQAAQLKKISVRLIEKKAPKWPASMEEGQASVYDPKPHYARVNGLKFWLATPVERHIPFGICLVLTSKKDPTKSVAGMTADTGGFGRIRHRFYDVSRSMANKLGFNGVLDVTAKQVDPSVCKSQS